PAHPAATPVSANPITPAIQNRFMLPPLAHESPCRPREDGDGRWLRAAWRPDHPGVHDASEERIVLHPLDDLAGDGTHLTDGVVGVHGFARPRPEQAAAVV